MHLLVIGAAGMVGRKFLERVAATGQLAGKAVSRATLTDVVAPSAPAGAAFACDCSADDLSAPGIAEKLVASRPDMIVHLAAIVSGEAEADFEKGYRINLDGTQKAIGELLLADYSRRGFFDGVGIRLPTIVVRPGKPNKAASGFFSGILREPLSGQEAILPVSDDVRHWVASPRAAVHFLEHAAGLDTAGLGARRNLTMPGLSVTVGEMIAALGRVAGPKAVSLIRREPDPVIVGIVAGWPRNFDPQRALSLGFKAEPDMDTIIRAHVEDELGGRIGG